MNVTVRARLRAGVHQSILFHPFDIEPIIMRLAVFTAEFPGRINTFFARDMSALLRAGIEIDIFPIYPPQPQYWNAVPDCLGPDVLPRDRVHYARPLDALMMLAPPRAWRTHARFLADTMRVRASAVRFGPAAWAKCEYIFPKAWSWARAERGRYDHVLAYWGNYAATAAYLFDRLLERDVPFSMLLHAHDLYACQIFLREKLLRAENIFIVCEFNRRFLAEQFPDIYPRIAHKVHLHHLGLEMETIEPAFDGRRPHTCLAVGRHDPSKGFDDLLRAAAIVRSRGIDLEVELVGDGEETEALKALAVSLGLAHSVRFLGWLPFDAVPARMRQATMLVHPSCGLGDAVPTVIKEAMAVGTPVVGTTAVGIPELLDHGRCGVLVPERDAERLANAIELLLRDAALRDELARAGRAFAERTFDLWKNGRQLADQLRATPAAPAVRAPAAAMHA